MAIAEEMLTINSIIKYSMKKKEKKVLRIAL